MEQSIIEDGTVYMEAQIENPQVEIIIDCNNYTSQTQFPPIMYVSSQNMFFNSDPLQIEEPQIQLENSPSEPNRGPELDSPPSIINLYSSPGRPPKSTTPKVTKCRCEICFKEFGHKSNLFIHMRTHNGERPYKCSHCEKCFTHSGNLAIHMRTHTNERPYTCQICGKKFSHSGNLSTHFRTHTGIKPYKCSVCHKEFRHSGNKAIHERIHSGIKPFKCKCGKSFYHSGNLTTHMKKHTENNLHVRDCEVSQENKREDISFEIKEEEVEIVPGTFPVPEKDEDPLTSEIVFAPTENREHFS